MIGAARISRYERYVRLLYSLSYFVYTYVDVYFKYTFCIHTYAGECIASSLSLKSIAGYHTNSPPPIFFRVDDCVYAYECRRFCIISFVCTIPNLYESASLFRTQPVKSIHLRSWLPTASSTTIGDGTLAAGPALACWWQLHSVITPLLLSLAAAQQLLSLLVHHECRCHFVTRTSEHVSYGVITCYASSCLVGGSPPFSSNIRTAYMSYITNTRRLQHMGYGIAISNCPPTRINIFITSRIT